MKQKFKTFYQNELIDCEISTFENLVSCSSKNFYKVIGRYEDKEISEGGLPILPIYRSTGKKDKNGDLIYEGHRLNINLFEVIFTVFWSDKRAGFYLRRKAFKFGKSVIKKFESVYCESRKCLIVDHISKGGL